VREPRHAPARLRLRQHALAGGLADLALGLAKRVARGGASLPAIATRAYLIAVLSRLRTWRLRARRSRFWRARFFADLCWANAVLSCEGGRS